MRTKATTILSACRSLVVDLVSGLFESRAKAIAILLAFLLGVVFCTVLSGNTPFGTCQMSPRWLLVDVGSTVTVLNDEDDGSLLDIIPEFLRDILGLREADEVELGLQMLNTCHIVQIRGGSSQDSTVIEMLPGPNSESHQITVMEKIWEICAALDCANAASSSSLITSRPSREVATSAGR